MTAAVIAPRTVPHLNKPPWVWFFYALLAFAVILPMLRPGYILTLDMVFTPHIHMPTAVNNGYLFYTLLHVLNYVLPSQVIEKGILFAIFMLAGVAMHRLVLVLGPTKWGDGLQPVVGAYAAGILYAINPFTYDRLMAGQYGVLLGYALLPFLASSLYHFLRKPSLRQSIRLALWATVAGIVSIHALGFVVVLGIVGVIFAGWQRRFTKDYLQLLAKYAMVAIVVFITLSSYWLVPLALGKGSTATQLAQFGTQDSAAFATTGDNAIERIANVIRLQGFWQESRSLYLLPQAMVHAWGLLALLVWIIGIVGAIRLWRSGQWRLVLAGIVLAAVAIVLASGLGNGWLTQHIPFFSGFREPQKFAALLAFCFAVGLGLGVPSIVRTARKQGGRIMAAIAAVLAVALPLAFTSVILWGAHGQLTPRQYPASWFAANRVLSKDRGTFQSVFLPWHLYMSYRFTGRIIASPAPNFFDKPVLVSDDPEFNGAGRANTSTAKQAVDALIPTAAADPARFAARLAQLNVKYVLLAHDNDFSSYLPIVQSRAFRPVYAGQAITVYRNLAYKEAS